MKEKDLIKISTNLLAVQLKLFVNGLNDSRFLTKLSKYVSIENKYISINRTLLLDILNISNYSGYDITSTLTGIEYLLYKLLEDHKKIDTVLFELDESANFSRLNFDKIVLKVKILEIEYIFKCKQKETLTDLGFDVENIPYWIGFFKNIPEKVFTLSGIDDIIGENLNEDNPKTLIKFPYQFYQKKQNSKILEVLNI